MSGFLNPRFESERLLMRPREAADATVLHEAYRDETLMTWWSSGPHANIEETHAYLDRKMPGRGWVVLERTTGAVVGTLATSATDRPGVAEIGYLLIRRYWGRGYARESVRRLVDLMFEEGNRRVWADVDPDNVASSRLLEALGFKLEGRLRGLWETHIGVRDSLIWGLLRDEWLSS